jgi:hypothetical protein
MKTWSGFEVNIQQQAHRVVAYRRPRHMIDSEHTERTEAAWTTLISTAPK